MAKKKLKVIKELEIPEYIAFKALKLLDIPDGAYLNLRGGYDNSDIFFTWQEEESDQEYEDRIEKEAATAERIKNNLKEKELKELARLRAKYGNS